MRRKKAYNPIKDVDISRRIAVGRHHQEMVSDMLRRRGIKCHCPNEDHGDDRGRWGRYDKDIIIDGTGDVIEVKSRSSTCIFTNPGDFPFDTVFVDTVAGYHAKEEVPVAYVFVSQDTGATVWLDGRRSDEWSKEHVYDSFLKYKTWTYCADRNELREFDELVKMLRREDGAADEGESGESH